HDGPPGQVAQALPQCNADADGLNWVPAPGRGSSRGAPSPSLEQFRARTPTEPPAGSFVCVIRVAINRLNRAEPVRARDVDGQEVLTAALTFLHDRGRVVEAHRLIVEERGVERRRVMDLEIGDGVSDQREARAV